MRDFPAEQTFSMFYQAEMTENGSELSVLEFGCRRLPVKEDCTRDEDRYVMHLIILYLETRALILN
jgi:predicted aldo/keto reductase-like oxidoreductase